MDTLYQDIRYALRSLRRSPGFTAVVLLTLALGVGANTAIFSVVNAVLLRPLPYEDAGHLVMVWARTEAAAQMAASWPEFVDWREQSQSFVGMAVYRGQSVNLTGTGEPERLIGAFVSSGFLPLLGAKPALGRGFRPEETEPETVAPVALISHGLWRRRFGSDPAVLGRTLTLNGHALTVVGIMGPDFEPGRAPADGWFMSTEAWIPAPYFPNARGLQRGQGEMLVAARLKPGVTPEQAQADMSLVASRLEKAYPDTHAGRGVSVTPLQEQIVGSMRTSLFVLLGAVGLVLLIGCANVGNLLLARAAQRQREMAVRSALGAGRRRLVRQLLTESALLSAAAGGLGLLLGAWGAQGLAALVPNNLPIPDDIGLDRSVLAFTLGVSVLTGIVFGIVPALHASRPDLNGMLKEAGRGAGAGRGRRHFRDALVVSEVALSLLLLVGAGLLLQSMFAMQRVDPGFRPDRILTLEFRLPPSKYAEPHQIATFFREILERVRQIPGVESAALVRAVPFSGNGGQDEYRVEGRPDPPAGKAPISQTNIVSPQYFRTLGIPMLQGRDFSEQDTAAAPAVVIVNATMATLVWPGEDPLGKRLWLKDAGRWLSVAGVVGDVKHGSFGEKSQAQAYMTHAQNAKIFACPVIRTAGEPTALAAAVRKAIWSVDKDQPMWKVRSLSSLLAGSRSPARAMATLLGIFAAVAVLLAALGIYGVLSFSVAQRTREIGVRLALGAPAQEVVRMVVGRAMTLTGLAVALGLLGAAALGRVMAGLLFGVGPTDPLTFLGAALALTAVSLVASYLPARRAARIDPVVALAEE